MSADGLVHVRRIHRIAVLGESEVGKSALAERLVQLIADRSEVEGERRSRKLSKARFATESGNGVLCTDEQERIDVTYENDLSEEEEENEERSGKENGKCDSVCQAKAHAGSGQARRRRWFAWWRRRREDSSDGGVSGLHQCIYGDGEEVGVMDIDARGEEAEVDLEAPPADAELEMGGESANAGRKRSSRESGRRCGKGCERGRRREMRGRRTASTRIEDDGSDRSMQAERNTPAQASIQAHADTQAQANTQTQANTPVQRDGQAQRYITPGEQYAIMRQFTELHRSTEPTPYDMSQFYMTTAPHARRQHVARRTVHMREAIVEVLDPIREGRLARHEAIGAETAVILFDDTDPDAVERVRGWIYTARGLGAERVYVVRRRARRAPRSIWRHRRGKDLREKKRRLRQERKKEERAKERDRRSRAVFRAARKMDAVQATEETVAKRAIVVAKTAALTQVNAKCLLL